MTLVRWWQRLSQTFREIAEASRGRDGGEVVLAQPQQLLSLAAGVEAVLLPQVPRGQEGAGVKALPGELDDLLGLNPAPVHEVEALQMNDLERKKQCVDYDFCFIL